MTRAQATKIADAIAARARREGLRSPVTEVRFPVGEVAAVLKKRPGALVALLLGNYATVWGCLPIGWTFLVAADYQSIVVARREG